MMPIKLITGRAIATALAVTACAMFLFAEEYEVRYWFDEDISNAKYCSFDSGNNSFCIGTGDLHPRAVHRLNLQLKDTDGKWSVVYSHFINSTYLTTPDLAYSIDFGGSPVSFSEHNSSIDLAKIQTGLHRLYVYDRNGNLPPCSSFFRKVPVQITNLLLTIESTREKLKKNKTVNTDQKELYVDVSDMPQGIYPITATLRNEADGSMLAASTSLADIRVNDGKNLKAIYYWLNDSAALMKKVAFPDAKPRYGYDGELAIADFDLNSNDDRLKIENEEPFVSPNYNIHIVTVNGSGFAIDSVMKITDNSKQQKLSAPLMQFNQQHDYGVVDPEDNYWTRFVGFANDKVTFKPRWDCKAKIYDCNANLIDTVTFNDTHRQFSLPVKDAGTCYIQLSNIKESSQIFSARLTSKIDTVISEQERPAYDGILVDWNSADNWNTSPDMISYSKHDIDVYVSKNSGVMPYVGERSNMCQAYEGNEIHFHSDELIDKVTLCLPEKSTADAPVVSTPAGEITIDTFENIIVWKGLANDAFIRLSRSRSAGEQEEMVTASLQFDKAYVNIFENDTYEQTSGKEEFPDDFNYIGYNTMRIWEKGTVIGQYRLENSTRITFSDSAVHIRTADGDFSHDIINRLIFTFSDDIITGMEKVGKEEPRLKITDSDIVISSLPNFVGIYAVDGKTLFADYVDSQIFSYPLDNLSRGIYIIKVGNTSTKIVIK